MSKRKIVVAAKRRGLSVVYAHWGWAAGDYDSHREWMVEFGPEIDELFGEDEIQNFVDISEALQWLEDLVALPPRPDWRPIAEAPQDGSRMMLWDSVSERPVFGSWRPDSAQDHGPITHYAAEPAGPKAP